MTFTIKPEYLTGTVVSKFGNTTLGIPASSENPVVIKTTDYANPNNVKSSNNVIVNPTTITVKYVDENGDTLSPDLVAYQPAGNPYTAVPEYFYGYKSPEAVALTLDREFVEHTFVYKKMTEQEMTDVKNSNISLETTHKDYLMGDRMAGTIKIDRSGFSTGTITNPTIKVEFSDPVFSTLSTDVSVSSVGGLQSKDIKVYDNYFTFTMQGNLNPGSTYDIPYTVMFKKNTTPENTQFYAKATLVDNNQPVAQSNSDWYIGHYNNPTMMISTNGSDYRGYVNTYDQTIVSQGDTPLSHVSDTGKNSLTYQLSVAGLQRTVGDYVITATLPEYDVDPHSKLPTAGSKQRAVFNPEKNPGWVLSPDKRTLHYRGNNDGKLVITPATLILDYPGAAEKRNIAISASAELTPYNKSETEDMMLVSVGTTNYFYKWVPPVGEVFVKRAGMPQDNGGTVFYDNTISRSKDFGWELWVNATQGILNDVVLTDNHLDPRMYYDRVSIPATLGDATVVARDASGATIFTQKILATENNRTVSIPDYARMDTAEVSIYIPNIQSGKREVVMVYTKLKEPEKSLFDDTPGSTKNVFHNNLDFSSREVSGSWGADKVLRAKDQTIQATKTTTYTGDTITGNSGSYTVGFRPQWGYGEDITNFEQVDLIPRGLEVTDVSKSGQFSSIPGSTVELIENYRDSGHDAVVWKAPLIPASKVTPGYVFVVGSVNTYISLAVPGGSMVNDVFVKANGAILASPVVDPRLGGDTWSKASTDTDITAAAGMEQRKSIRSYDADGNPGSWQTGITTTLGQRMDYRLRVTNGTDRDRDGLAIYDVLPAKGDLGLADDSKQTPRESVFSNVLDTSREIKVPAGLRVQYHEGAIPGYTLGDATSILPGLEWRDTPSGNTTAIRIIQDQGGYTLGGRQSLDIIIPMIANQDTDDIPGVPAQRNVNQKAWNSFFYLDNQQTRLIEGNRVYNEMVKPPVSVEFRKTGIAGGLGGASFEYRRGDGTVVAAASSAGDGMVRFPAVDMNPGDYIVETDAPFGYTINPEQRVFTAEMVSDYYSKDADGTINLPDFANWMPWVPIKPQLGNVEFTKVDAVGKPLSGVRFTLTRSWWADGVYYTSTYDAVSNNDGVVSFKNVAAGSGYTLTEVSAPRAIQPTAKVNNITVKNGETTKPGTTNSGVANSIVNSRMQVPINKIGVSPSVARDVPFGSYDYSHGTGIFNVRLEVWDVAGNRMVGAVNSDPNSAPRIPNLAPNTVYEIREPTPPSNATPVAGMVQRFMITPDGVITDEKGNPFPAQNVILVPNILKPANRTIVVSKTGYQYGEGATQRRGESLGDPLAGAVFQLESQNPQTKEWSLYGDPQTTDAAGKVSWVNPPSGVYRYREVSAPAGYLLSNYGTSKEIVLSDTTAGDIQFYVTNPQIHMDVLKVEMIARDLTSQGAAEALIATLPDGDGMVARKNNRGLFDIVKPLGEAEFQLRATPDGAPIETATTDDQGRITFTSTLDRDSLYYLVETSAPRGYRGSTDPVVIDPKSYQNGYILEVVQNNKDRGRLVVSKVNADTGSPIMDGSASFRVQKMREDASGVEFNGGKWIVDDSVRGRDASTDERSGALVMDSLDFGVYQVVETSSPDGYVLNETPRLFEVSEDDSVFTHVFANTPASPEIEIVKDINGHSADTEVDAVLLQPEDDTMDVTFTVRNLGNARVDKVRVTDAVTRGGDEQKINALLENALITVADNDSETAGTSSGEYRNGEFSLIPGASATVRITVDAPQINELHSDTATVSVDYHGSVYTDENPAHAYRVSLGFPLPDTGVQALALFGLCALAGVGAVLGGVSLWRRRA